MSIEDHGKISYEKQELKRKLKETEDTVSNLERENYEKEDKIRQCHVELEDKGIIEEKLEQTEQRARKLYDENRELHELCNDMKSKHAKERSRKD